MYTVIQRFTFDPQVSSKLAQAMQGGLVPLLQEMPDFVAYYWLDAGNGVMASVSVFEDRSGADESVRMAREWVRQNAATLIPNAPQVTEGHVVATGSK